MRQRARSGAAVAAVNFAVFLAMLIGIIASVRFSNVLDYTGPNLTSEQLIMYTQDQGPNAGPGGDLTTSQTAALRAKVDAFAASLHAQPLAIQVPQPLTSAQISTARRIAVNTGATVETKSGELGLTQISDGATVLGLVIALGVLVLSVGQVRSQTTGELRTLAATGTSSRIRRSSPARRPTRPAPSSPASPAPAAA